MKSEYQLFKEKMELENPAAYKYSYTSVVVFGILGNILVIISILRQKKLLKNSYYYLVLHLAICDLGWLVVRACTYVQHDLFQENKTTDKIYCLFYEIKVVFQIAGLYMMLVISVLRYRATLHPLKPEISREKLRVVCGFGYILGFIVGVGGTISSCFLRKSPLASSIYTKLYKAGTIFLIYYAPTVVMAVLYGKIYRALMNQNKYLKSLGSNPAAQSTSGSSFTIAKYLKNHKTFLVSVSIVFCYAVGNLPMSLVLILKIAGNYDLLKKQFWLWYLAFVLRAAGSHSVNPLVYGILDKKLQKFWRLCSKRVRRQDN